MKCFATVDVKLFVVTSALSTLNVDASNARLLSSFLHAETGKVPTAHPAAITAHAASRTSQSVSRGLVFACPRRRLVQSSLDQFVAGVIQAWRQLNQHRIASEIYTLS